MGRNGLGGAIVNLQSSHVLVTGAAGFIGSHLLELLLEEGAQVKAFVHYNSANRSGFIDTLPNHQKKEIDLFQADLRDPNAVRKAMVKADIVFHLGALIAIPYSYQSPYDVLQTNALGSFHVAQAALEQGVHRVIHTSTSEVYGTARYVPMDEMHPLQGQSPYSASKIAADKVMESFHCAYQLPIVTIRPFNAYGPRQSMRAVIPTIINQALFSSEVKLGTLSTTRDFTYVEDTARAFICAAKADHAVGSTVNVGSGFEVSIGDIAKKVLRLLGRDIPISSVEERRRPETSEVDRLYCDNQLAQRVFDWHPTVSFEEGLQRTIKWISQNRSLYRPDDYVV